MKISSAVCRPDGVHVRVVSPVSPRAGTRSVEPTLEDAFLFVLSGSREASVEAVA